MLQEYRSAIVRVALLLPPQFQPSSLTSGTVVCGSGSSAGEFTLVSGVYLPLDSAAAAVTSLNVEPGG